MTDEPRPDSRPGPPDDPREWAWSDAVALAGAPSPRASRREGARAIRPEHLREAAALAHGLDVLGAPADDAGALLRDALSAVPPAGAAIVMGQGPAPQRRARARHWHRTLWESGYPVRLVRADDDLADHRILVVPEPADIGPDAADGLTRAVAAGVHLLVEGPVEGLAALLGAARAEHGSGPRGEDGPRRPDPSGALVDRISRGVAPEAGRAPVGPPTGRLPLRADDPGLARALDLIASPAPAPAALDAPRPLALGDGARVVASLPGADGTALPVVTRRPEGAGFAWCVAAPLDAVTRSALIRLVAARARLHPTRTGLPDGVEAQQVGRILFLLNHGPRAVELSGVEGSDLLSGAACTGHVVLAPRSAMAVLR
ncbi:hypothetical protein M3T53_07430 [Actinomyces sp. B33]|uniref:hypothetical protein n=1 Tax=Actinomyces sp. B33 TaxID=2942131 RepID=UPI0023426BB3|nr:hypothetical protein [Actinomyces sp. B33]MDC4233536.1 hypothetical protein [Actinomyces sp. B33]